MDSAEKLKRAKQFWKLLKDCVYDLYGPFFLGSWNQTDADVEVREECGLEVDSLEKVGVLQFEFVGQPPVLEVHVFGTSCFTGEPVDTEEMSPKWFSIGEVPFDRMWPDDRIWFPMYLGDKKFQGHFLYEGLDHIRSHTLVVVDHLPS